jgi:flagellar FliL protein
MATKPKDASPPDDEEDEGEEGAKAKDGEPKKAGLVGRILGPVLALPRLLNPLAILKLPLKLKLIVGGGTLATLLIVGGAFYFLHSASPPENAEEAAAPNVKTAPANLPPAQAAFFDIPDIIVNLQTPDTSQAYLKLSVSLELEKAELKPAIEPVLPRVIDQFQSYLRELRVEDVRGSAGVMRLKEELLRRVNLAVAPTPVRDVLLKEMIVQ